LKRKIIVIGIVIVLAIGIGLAIYVHSINHFSVEGYNKVQSADIEEAFTGKALERYSFGFDFSKKKQRDKISEIISWLNLSKDSAVINHEQEPMYQGGDPNTHLGIKFYDGESINVYVSKEYNSAGEITVIREDLGIRATEICPKLAKFLNSDWKNIKPDMNNRGN
jgi:hypothetical protein